MCASLFERSASGRSVDALRHHACHMWPQSLAAHVQSSARGRLAGICRGNAAFVFRCLTRLLGRFCARDRQGQWRRDRRHGSGTLHAADGSLYAGEFIDDRRDGRGCMRYANGDVFEGEWVSGRRHGEGRLQASDGRTYVRCRQPASDRTGPDRTGPDWTGPDWTRFIAPLRFRLWFEHELICAMIRSRRRCRVQMGRWCDDQPGGPTLPASGFSRPHYVEGVGIVGTKNLEKDDEYEHAEVRGETSAEATIGIGGDEGADALAAAAADAAVAKAREARGDSHGLCTYPDGSQYIGEWLLGKRHGRCACRMRRGIIEPSPPPRERRGARTTWRRRFMHQHFYDGGDGWW